MKRVLIVDDETDITYTLKKMLETQDYQVETYNDPVLVSQIFKPVTYDFILLDIKMPGMDGFELYRQIRKKDENVIICFMSAYEVFRDQFGEFSSPQTPHFIKKPVDMTELRKIILEPQSNPDRLR